MRWWTWMDGRRFALVGGAAALVLAVLALPVQTQEAVRNSVLDVHLNNERGPLSVLVKMEKGLVKYQFKREGKKAYVLTLPDAELAFQNGRFSKITVGGLGLAQVEVMPVEQADQRLVRVEMVVQDGFSVVDRSDTAAATLQFDVLPLPSGSADASPQAKVPDEEAALPGVPSEPAVMPGALAGSGAIDPALVQPPSPQQGGIGALPYAEELLLSTDASASGPHGVKTADATMLATRITNLSFQRADVADVLSLLALKGRFNVVLGKGVSGEVTLSLSNVSVKEALDILSRLSQLSYKVYENTVLVMADAKEKSLEPMETELLELSYASPDNVKAVVEGLKLVENGVIQTLPYAAAKAGSVDTATSTLLVVKETRDNLRMIRQIAEKLDRKPRQVQVEVRFVDVKDSFLKEMLKAVRGIKPDVPNDENAVYTYGSDEESGNLQSLGEQLLSVNILTRHKSLSLANFLRAKQVTEEIEVLSSPSIVILEGQEGTVDLTEKRPFLERGQTGDSGAVTETVKTVDIGVQLTVVPRIDRDGGITMVIQPKLSSSGGVDERTGVVIEISNEVETTVRVQDGETLVLGGLINQDHKTTMSKVPLLGDLPVLKKFFRSKSTSSEKRELVVFVTPKIIEDV